MKNLLSGLLAGLFFVCGWVSCEVLQKIKDRWNRAALVETNQDRQRVNQLTEEIIEKERGK